MKNRIVVAAALSILVGMSAGAARADSAVPAFRVLYPFHLGNDGGFPGAGVIADSAGNLYGTTEGGGYSYSTVYMLTPPPTPGATWIETTLHAFANKNDGLYPVGGLVFDTAGNLYGTTGYGGDYACIGGCGVVFRLSPPAHVGGGWTYTVLYKFKGGRDGVRPYSERLILDRAGNLYGTTLGGGTALCSGFGCGTVFELSPPPAHGTAWTESIIHRFGYGADGTMPFAGVIFDKSGDLYRTTREGGPLNNGTVFELQPPVSPGMQWTEQILYRFGGKNFDGLLPTSTLVFDALGNLYGTTQSGGNGCGAGGCGTVFRLAPPAAGHPTWRETILHSFDNTDGNEVDASVIFDQAGDLYGTTYLAGFNGNVFQLTPSDNAWAESVLYQFTGGDDGQGPVGDLIGYRGTIFGVTNAGGVFGAGTVYQVRLTLSANDLQKVR